MSDALTEALSELLGHIVFRVKADAELVRRLRSLAEAFLSATDERPQQASPAPEAMESAAAMAGTEPAAMPRGSTASIAPAEVTPSVPTLAGRAHQVSAAPPLAPVDRFAAPFARAADCAPVGDDDLPVIEARCRLKAEAARWHLARRRQLEHGAEFPQAETLYGQIIARAKALPDCFLWMCHPRGPRPADLSLMETVAGCFDAMAAGIELVRDLLAESDSLRDPFEQAVQLLAESTSALQGAVEQIGGVIDREPHHVFQWLKMTGIQKRIYLPRFMRTDDPADPGCWPDLLGRIEGLKDERQRRQERERRQEAALNRIRYHLKAIARRDGEHCHDWEKVVDAVEQLVGEGLAPSNRQIRELLLPVMDDLPDVGELPPGFRLVLREMDRFLAAHAPEDPALIDGARSREKYNDLVQEAKRLVNGRSAVLIGGIPRPRAQESLRVALGLYELYWVDARDHEPTSTFEPAITRADVAVVLLAIRWSSHSFGDVKQLCDRHGKPLVRLPAGYSPNQVAAQILSQCSHRLSGALQGRDRLLERPAE